MYSAVGFVFVEPVVAVVVERLLRRRLVVVAVAVDAVAGFECVTIQHSDVVSTLDVELTIYVDLPIELFLCCDFRREEKTNL